MRRRGVSFQVLVMTLAVTVSVAAAGYAGEPRLKESVAYYDDGTVRERTLQTAGGAIAEKRSYYDDGSLRELRRFDRDGHTVEEAHFDSDGELESTIDGWAAKRWRYVEGTLRAESIYGPDGRLQERKIYNELGDLVRRQYADETPIDESEEFNRGSVATLETDDFYDRYGRKTGSMTTAVDDPDDMFDGWPYWW